jgi:hypothetical protein
MLRDDGYGQGWVLPVGVALRLSTLTVQQVFVQY